MTRYSNSRLETFKQCKYKYKLQYIDRVRPDVPDKVETFMGSMVHETLDKLYRDLKGGFLNTKDEVIKFYGKKWRENWSDDILIVKSNMSQSDYFSKGMQFLEDYYEKHKPFNQAKIVDLETEDFLELEDGNQYHIRIDRLSSDGNGNYFVCDYKTNNRLKSQWEVDEDRQLAMYSIWVKRNFEDCKDVKLVWYFLAFNTELVSSRTDEQLNKLKKEIEILIKEVESCEDFQTNKSMLCNWCEFKNQCPEFNGNAKLSDF
jgi:putative RecB family exonuclease